MVDPSADVRRPIGAHAAVSGGLGTGALRYAVAVGAEAIQVFVSSPRGWAAAAGDERQDAVLRGQVAETGLPVFVHAPYLINVGSPDPELRRRSADSIRHALRRAREIAARGVVVHTGSATDGDRPAALRRLRECLLPLLDTIGGGDPDLLLEPMAGQGQTLCAAAGDLEPYLDALDWHPRANVCLDTCHLFAAGHDLTTGCGLAQLAAELRAATRDSAGRLRLIHANDSAAARGSARDRHQTIGRGQIGTAAFGLLLRHPLTARVPFIVETPGGERGHAADVATLRALRDAPAPPGSGAGPAATDDARHELAPDALG
jgi:deoxyribonuclease IV